VKQSRDSPEASRIISAKKAGSTKATSHVTKPDGQFASSSSEKGSEIREKFADPHNIGQADANVEGYEATQQSKDNSGLAKTASIEYLVQLYQHRGIGEHPGIHRHLQSQQGESGRRECHHVLEPEVQDAESLLYTLNVCMAHITSPLYRATLQPEPSDRRLVYNRQHVRIGGVIRSAFFEPRGDDRLDITDKHSFFTSIGPGIAKLRRAVIIGFNEDEHDGIVVVHTTSFGKSGKCPPQLEKQYANFLYIKDYVTEALRDMKDVCYKGSRAKSDARSSDQEAKGCDVVPAHRFPRLPGLGRLRSAGGLGSEAVQVGLAAGLTSIQVHRLHWRRSSLWNTEDGSFLLERPACEYAQACCWFGW